MDQTKQKEGVRVGTFGRRKWDVEVFARKAAEREEREKSGFDTDEKRKRVIPSSELKTLQARTGDIDLEKNVGIRARVIGEPQFKASVRRVQSSSSGARAGFYCDLCECVIKDSISYVDHLNSRTHIRNMGMSMRAERATLEAVLKKLDQPPRKKSGARRKAQADQT